MGLLTSKSNSNGKKSRRNNCLKPHILIAIHDPEETYHAHSPWTRRIIQQSKLSSFLLWEAKELSLVDELLLDVTDHLLLPWFGVVVVGAGAVGKKNISSKGTSMRTVFEAKHWFIG